MLLLGCKVEVRSEQPLTWSLLPPSPTLHIQYYDSPGRMQHASNSDCYFFSFTNKTPDILRY